MKTLEKQFIKNGFEYFQIFRDGDIAVYEQKLGALKWFEVFYVQHIKERIIAGKTIPESESMPGNEQWGHKGWTFYELEAALAKAVILQEKEENQKNSIAH